MITSSKKILFLTQWHYNDALIQTYTLPYISIIKKITHACCYLVTPGKNNKRLYIKKRGNCINIELPDPTKLYRLQWLINVFILACIVRKKHISVIHSWCTPAGSIAAILKMFYQHINIVLDSVEPHAEAMVECKVWKRTGIKFSVLFYLEKLQIKKADYLIFAASGMEKYIAEKFKLNLSGYVKPACVDLSLFSKDLIKGERLLKETGLENKTVCVYAGKLGGFYIEDEVFAFIKECENYWGAGKFNFLLLSNVTDEYVQRKCLAFTIARSTITKLFVPHADVPKYMALADFAISPFKPVPSKRYGTPVKNGEYWALGLPVVITPDISIDSDIIKQRNAGAILQGLTRKDYIQVIQQIDTLIKGKSRKDIYNLIRPLAEKYRNYSIAEDVYAQIYKG